MSKARRAVAAALLLATLATAAPAAFAGPDPSNVAGCRGYEGHPGNNPCKGGPGQP